MVSCVFLLLYRLFFYSRVIYVFFLMIRRPPRSTRLTHSFPTRRSSDLTTLLRSINGLVPHFTGGTLSGRVLVDGRDTRTHRRSEEHTSELQSLMRISYAVFCLKKKKHHNNK